MSNAHAAAVVALAAVVLVCGCAAVPPNGTVDGVRVVQTRSYPEEHGCYLIGDVTVAPDAWTMNPQSVLISDTKRLGGDTLLDEGSAFSLHRAYVCDPQRAAALRQRDEAIARVRVTNRQDVVQPCKFVANADGASEAEVRAKAVDLKGNVFYVVSDTSRTAMDKPIGSRTTYNYEVRRLTGEVYACP